MKVLIAEDARDIAEVVGFGVRMTWPGCVITIVETGTDALTALKQTCFDLAILDIEMPPPDGFELCRTIRESSNVPVLMLTVRDATIDKVRALDLGADDYLTKPFDHLELLARLRALVRRASGSGLPNGPDFVSEDLVITFPTREVLVRGEPVKLTSTEFRVLEELVRNAGQILPHQVLLDNVWGSEWHTDPRYLKVFIRRLRKKLGDDADSPRYIHTEWGIGYRFIGS